MCTVTVHSLLGNLLSSVPPLHKTNQFSQALKITSQKNCSIISTTRSHIHYQSVIMYVQIYSVYIYEPALLRCLDRICFFILLSHNYHTKFSALKLSQIYHIKRCTKISSSVIQASSLSILSVTFSHNYHIANI